MTDWHIITGKLKTGRLAGCLAGWLKTFKVSANHLFFSWFLEVVGKSDVKKGVDSGLTPNSLTRQELEQKQGRQLERRLGRRLGKQLLSIKPLKPPSKPQWQQLRPSLERQVPNWEKRRATKWEKSPESGGWATLRLGSRRANIQAVGSGSPRPSK